jgi:hypothetical protein
MRTFEEICGCIYRDVGILQRLYVRCPIHPRHDLWRLVELLLDAALLAERLALGIDSYGVLPRHEKTSEASPSEVSENCND